MRQFKSVSNEKSYTILTLDDDRIITSTIQAFFQRTGYKVDVENNPLEAIERVRNGSYDILLLDYLMSPICGDQVVERIREFNRELSIIMLTGHKDMAPPLQTLRTLDIQGYYEKSDRFDQLELMVEACVKSIRQLRTIREYRNGLHAMLDSMPEFYHQAKLEDIADQALQIAGSFLPCAGGSAALKQAGGDAPVWTVRSFGMDRFASGDATERAFAKLQESGAVFEENLVAYPLALSSDAGGFLWLQTTQPLTEEQKQLSSIFVRQLSAAVDNALLHDTLKEKNAELDLAYSDLGKSYTEMIVTMRRMVDAKDINTRNHSDRVAFYAGELARHLGKDEHYCKRVSIAGLFHDVGKISIPDQILQKPSGLSDEEYLAIQSHAERGGRILSGFTAFRDLVPWVAAHHERYDGTGYPKHLAGESIPEQARIITVADSFDTMTSDRKYRGALDLECAFSELVHGKGSQFDPEITDAFIDLMKSSDCYEKAKSIDFDILPFSFFEV